ncbi:tachylectin-2-like isoform X2 [Ambystoma mexicanum]|uniref:tachylectin-2-like isoform X2 n=1 Tax=Ambystoma mexicanum TaxID=8296 RepID=UPI0037E7967D
MSRADVVLFTVDKGNQCKAGLPPADFKDSYNSRAQKVGILANVSKIAFGLDDKLYAVRGSELFQGTMPSSEGMDWFQGATRVGKTDWDRFRFILFHPKGTLYVVTREGELYKGPTPTNENVPWLYSQAKKIGNSGWEVFHALFFDHEGMLHGVTSDTFVKDFPPTGVDKYWLRDATRIGNGPSWEKLSHFMAFTPDGNLWAVDKKNGDIYTGPPPTHKYEKWQDRAKKLGYNYNMYKVLAFTRDKTIMKILNLDFLTDIGTIFNEGIEVVAEQDYDNKDSSTPLNSTFKFDKTYTQESTFSHDHGFAIAVGAETSFKTGIPFIAEGQLKISLSASTTHNWNFGEKNTTTTNFSLSSNFVVQPGKAVHQKAVVKKAKIDVPYCATILTIFGYKTTISGIWKGVCYFNLRVKQTDV